MTLFVSRSRLLRVLTFLPLIIFAQGCGRAPVPPENPAAATVKWEGATNLNLEEWTELVGGTVPLPDRVARVTSQVEARVANVLTDATGKPIVEGQRLDKGAVLVQLDDTIVKGNLAKLEATQIGLVEDEKQAQGWAALANKEFDKLRNLKETDDKMRGSPGHIMLVSQIDWETAINKVKDTESKYRAASSRQLAGSKDIEILKEQLKFYKLSAPISGRVGRVQVVPGQTLAVGTPVADVVDLDDQIDVLGFVPRLLVRRLAIGQKAKSGAVDKDADAPPEPEATGQIVYIAEQAEPETGNFAVKVRFPNKEVHLRANQVVRIRVLTQVSTDSRSLPESAIMEDEDPPTVLVVDAATAAINPATGKVETTYTARKLQVKLGIRDRILHQVAILELIDPEKEPDKKWQGKLDDPNTLFITEGGHGLQTGDAVKMEAEGD